MARKIKDTPVLTGKNAEHFNKILEKNKGKKVSKEEYKDTMSTYNRIIANSNIG